MKRCREHILRTSVSRQQQQQQYCQEQQYYSKGTSNSSLVHTVVQEIITLCKFVDNMLYYFFTRKLASALDYNFNVRPVSKYSILLYSSLQIYCLTPYISHQTSVFEISENIIICENKNYVCESMHACARCRACLRVCTIPVDTTLGCDRCSQLKMLKCKFF